MKKNLKTKMICDYIYLKKIYDFAKNLDTDCDFLKERTQRLIKIYRKIFFKFGFFDLSFAILQKELKEDNVLCANLQLLNEKVSKIENETSMLLDKLKLNEFEKNYVVE